MAQELLEVFTCDSDPAMQEADSSDIGMILEQYSSYITAQVENLVGQQSRMWGGSMLDKDDIAQLVLIKFWLALKKKRIDRPGMYIKRMVYNEYVTMLRGCKPILPLYLGEEDDMQDDNTIIISCEEKDLPEFQVEQEDAAAYCARRAATAIGTLAPRQKRAMECSLHEHLDDPTHFKDAFDNCGLNIEDAGWPTRKAEKHLLNASLSAARTKVAQLMNFDLDLYKQKGASYLLM